MSDIPLQELAEQADSIEAEHPSVDGTGGIFAWRSASHTDVGRVRPINEDAFLDAPEQRLWVVADGMGGHSRGDYASSAVVKQLGAFPHNSSLLFNLKDLEDRIQTANDKCRTAFRNKKPGTTVVAMLAHGGHCFFLWAGDSRVYRLRDQTLEQLTVDHSVAQKKVASGEISAEEADDHKDAHVLTRAVGIRAEVQLDLAYARVQEGDRYLLCSDGMYNPVDSSELQNCLAQGGPEDACQALVSSAMAHGGPDNITVIVVEAGGT